MQPGASETGEAATLLGLRGVRKRFGGVLALDGVDFELRPGEVHALVGENGAGKSTLMKLLAGTFADYEGELTVDGKARHFGSPAAAQACGIAMVHQELSTFPHLSVAENVLGRRLPVRRGLVDWSEVNRRAGQQLRELSLEIDVTVSMGTLPVGAQQLVEIARVILSGARVIILDEPTSALSPPETRRLFDFMRSLKAAGKSLVFISHFLEDVLAISDRITILKNGRRVATLGAREANKQLLVGLMIGADAAALNRVYELDRAPAATSSERPTAQQSSGMLTSDEVLRVDGLTHKSAFEQISFSLHKREILGCFAFMGAGQSQLGRCLFGAERADAGSLRLDGRPLRLTKTSQARAAGIAFVPEDRRSALMLSKEVFKNITIAHLASLLPCWLRPARELAIASTWLERVGVRPADPVLTAGSLSGGNQQKVVLAKWLVRTPRILILNEPTRGMDVGAKEEVLGVITGLRQEGVAILVISTEPETILSLADRALVMHKGRINAELAGPELTKENLMKYA